MPQRARFASVTRILFHKDHAEQTEVRWLEWDTLFCSGEASRKLVAQELYLDAAIIYANKDPDFAWPLVWQVVERFPGAPVLIVCDEAKSENWFRAVSRPGVVVLPDLGYCMRKLRYLFKYKLHDGVFHRTTHVMVDKGLSVREAQCLLLRGSDVPDRIIGARLEIDEESVRSYLKTAAKKTGDATVSVMVKRLQEEAREEARKNPFDPEVLISPWGTLNTAAIK